MQATELAAQPPKPKLFEGVTAYHWLVLIIAAGGWLFDCMGQRIFVLAREPAFRELLGSGATDAMVKFWGGRSTFVLMFGWATGGILFGMMSDRLGRVKTMIATRRFVLALRQPHNPLRQVPVRADEGRPLHRPGDAVPDVVRPRPAPDLDRVRLATVGRDVHCERIRKHEDFRRCGCCLSGNAARLDRAAISRHKAGYFFRRQWEPKFFLHDVFGEPR